MQRSDEKDVPIHSCSIWTIYLAEIFRQAG